MTYDYNPCRWAVPLLLQHVASELGNVFRQDSEVPLAVDGGSMFADYIDLMSQLRRLVGSPTLRQRGLLDGADA